MILGWKRPGKVRRRHFFIRPHGQAVKTSPFHGGNSSSILDGVTKQRAAKKAAFYIICGYAIIERMGGRHDETTEKFVMLIYNIWIFQCFRKSSA